MIRIELSSSNAYIKLVKISNDIKATKILKYQALLLN